MVREMKALKSGKFEKLGNWRTVLELESLDVSGANDLGLNTHSLHAA